MPGRAYIANIMQIKFSGLRLYLFAAPVFSFAQGTLYFARSGFPAKTSAILAFVTWRWGQDKNAYKLLLIFY